MPGPALRDAGADGVKDPPAAEYVPPEAASLPAAQPIGIVEATAAGLALALPLALGFALALASAAGAAWL